MSTQLHHMKIASLIGMVLLHAISILSVSPSQIYLLQNGKISFQSEAPLELIRAQSDALQGALDIDKNTFAFTIKMGSFDGFNSLLQREHFCEKFMDCERIPKSSFYGKIIEKIDYSVPGKYEVRAKGKLNIHGLEKERIIRGFLEIRTDTILIDAQFQVPLEDHKIDIPKVVEQNIAERIEVQIHAELIPK